jgi:hypothetical protein
VATTDTYVWEITAGDSESVEFRFVDAAGAAIDIDADTFACQVRAERDSTSTLLATATCVASDTNLVTVSLTATQTRALGDADGRRFYSDLQQTSGSTINTTFPIVVVVTQDITR